MVVAAAGGAVSAEGLLGGVVRLVGDVPPAREITPIRADRFCGPLHDAPVMTRTYVVGEDRGLGNVVVAVTSDLGAVPFTVPTEQPLIDQAGCVYEPLVTTVMTNQTFRVRNSDSFMHNVNAQARVNRGFNFAQAVKGQENARVFAEPEAAIKFICNVHPWMAGYVWVFPHPFHAVTDKDGRWKFSRPLPPGRYEITFTHLRAGSKTATVEVTAGGALQLEAELAVPPS